MNNGRNKLEHWRSKIDTLDAELLELLNRRARIACEIASIKAASGLPAYDPQRETEVLSKVAALNQGPLEHQSIHAIFSSIIRETRRLGTERMQELAMKETRLARSQSGNEKEAIALPNGSREMNQD
jgi:chorismate mutase-like protein